MKKTLAAVAVLGAFAGSALAADVTLYGRADLGLQYVHQDNKGEKTDNWGLQSGDATSSRFGIKGQEQISEGLVVGFQLEHGFNADDGTDADDTRAFSRESRLYVTTDYGTLHMGRFGALDSGTGSVDVAAAFTASGTGYGTNINDQSRVLNTFTTRMDNSIAYTSPEFAGMTFHAMTSLGSDYEDDEDNPIVTGAEGSSDVDRYYGLGVTGQWGNFGAGLVVSQVDYGHNETPLADEDALNVTGGVNYDFGVAKVFLAANYYQGGEQLVAKHSRDLAEDYSQWGVSLSASAPLVGGTFETAVGYAVGTDDAAASDEDEKKMFNIGAMYKYPLSKRTYVYAGAGYDQIEDFDGEKIKTTEVITGLVHQF